MIFDTHIHTHFSSDSKMSLAQAMEKARLLDIGLIITEHMDLAYPEPEAFVFDVNQYLGEYAEYRGDRLLLGIEVGMRQDCLEESCKIIQSYPFDYVIGSIHVIENIDIYYEIFYKKRSKQEVYGHYFDAMARCLECYDCIDSLGHIDYIARYARYPDAEIHYNQFSQEIDKVLTILAHQQKAIEINTRRLSDPAIVKALLPIYKRFYELGGRMATIGSDAHKPEDVGRDLKTAIEIAEACNLKVVWFKNRQPQYMK